MAELIDRQVAIDAVTDELDMIDHVPQWVFDRLEKRLKQLPPALRDMDTDTISRQAAIDVLDAYQVKIENGEENPYAWARLRMSELPSTQPEIIRCKDCKHLFNKDDEWGKCWHFNGFSKVVSYDDFCSRAERITDETD